MASFSSKRIISQIPTLQRGYCPSSSSTSRSVHSVMKRTKYEFNVRCFSSTDYTLNTQKVFRDILPSSTTLLSRHSQVLFNVSNCTRSAKNPRIRSFSTSVENPAKNPRIRSFSTSVENPSNSSAKRSKSPSRNFSTCVTTTTEKDDDDDKKPANGKKVPEASIHTQLLKVCKLAWPHEHPHLQTRLAGSFGCLLLGKIFTVLAPLELGKLINSLADSTATKNSIIGTSELLNATSGTTDASIETASNLAALSTAESLPFWFLASYGMSRILSSGFSELRTYLFSHVVQNGCRNQAKNVFQHLHTLDIDYLLTLKGGEIQAIINRALKSIQMVLNTVLFNVAPTVLEFTLVMGVVYSTLGGASAALIGATFGSYFTFTTVYSNKRRKWMKDVNNAEDHCGGLLIDSIINAEAVRYFGTKAYETARYDVALSVYEKRQIRILESLAALNFGQQFIINSGITAVVGMATWNVLNGTLPVGDVLSF